MSLFTWLIRKHLFLVMFTALSTIHVTAVSASQTDNDASEPRMRFAVVLLSMQACCPDKYWAEAEVKVAKELAAGGFQVDRVDGQGGTEQDLRLSLIRLTKERNVLSAVMILKVPPSLGAGVDIWISDRLTEQVIVRHLQIDETSDAYGAALVGLKTVEALQSSYLEIARLAPKEVKSKIPEEVKAVTRSSADEKNTEQETSGPSARSFLGLGMGGGAMWSPGGFGVPAFGGLTLQWNPLTYLALDLDVAFAALIQEVATRNVVSSFQLVPLRAWCLYSPLEPYRVRPVVGLGGGVVLVQSKAVGSYPYEGETARTVVGTFGGTAHLLVSLSRYLRLRAGIRVSALFPEVSLSFSGYPVGSFGRPVVEGFLSLEARFYWPDSD